MNYNIQRLRAVAALWVLLFHAIPFYEQAGGNLGVLKPLFAVGYAGVDLFFVISGFIIAKSFRKTHATRTEVARFLEKRLYRIYLGYWPMLILVSAIYLWAMPARLEHVDVVRTLFLLSHKIPGQVIGQAWSLSFELFFYLAFALLALLSRRTGLYLVLAYATVVVVLNLREPEIATGFFANPRILELFAGMLLGWSAIGEAKANWSSLSLLVGATLSLFVFWMSLVAPTRLTTVLCLGGCALALVVGAELLKDARSLNRPSLTSRLGDSSYSLYLIHYLLLEMFALYMTSNTALKTLLPSLFWLWVVCIVLIGHVFYRVIEKPIYDFACRARGLKPAVCT